MIKRLKVKVLTTIMFFVTIIIVTLVAVINIIPRQQSRSKAFAFMNQRKEEMGAINLIKDGNLPPIAFGKIPPKEPIPKNNNMFSFANVITAEFDGEGKLLRWSSDRQDLYDEDYIKEIAKDIRNMNREFGVWKGNYYHFRDMGKKSILVLLDNSVAFENFQSTLVMTIISGVCAWVLLLVMGILLVNKMIKPIDTAFEKQRQFISDAGHELKTPVAVIAANADILENDIGVNKWLSYIHTETKQMDKLIKNLMMLAEIDDATQKKVHAKFDLSQGVLGASLPFESLAFENGKELQLEIQPDIQFFGNKEQMNQLISILLSNAIKYGEDGGVIRVTLSKEHKSILLSVYNTGIGIKEEEQDKIFDRFYRVDKDRSRKSGNYGLGLAIAKSITDEHHGKIRVNSKYGEFISLDFEFEEKRFHS